MDKNKIQVNNQKTPTRSRKRLRLTDAQIQEMEELFKVCPRPKKRQKLDLSAKLGLAPHRVQYWFQNRLAQMKAAQMTYAIENFQAYCQTREGPVLSGEFSQNEYVQRLTLENPKLEEEISHSVRIRSDLVKPWELNAAMNVAKEVIQMALVGAFGSSTTPTKDLSSFDGYHRSSLYTKSTSVVFMAGITLVKV
ncbi:hypothetical protein SUGI_0188810 [Cryptomeria japonica]|nr:hypothetical protein SUGI_0188810 [Cryptomeria japonica]